MLQNLSHHSIEEIPLYCKFDNLFDNLSFLSKHKNSVISNNLQWRSLNRKVIYCYIFDELPTDKKDRTIID